MATDVAAGFLVGEQFGEAVEILGALDAEDEAFGFEHGAQACGRCHLDVQDKIKSTPLPPFGTFSHKGRRTSQKIRTR